MKNLRLYPPIKVVGQDFTGVKVVTVPHQSMTLKEIIKRFIRRESLPVEKDGFYAEHYGDLEKMANEDITVQMERVADLKAGIKAAKAREKKAKESASAGSPPTPPVPPTVPPTIPSVSSTPPAASQGA